ncbi:MAG TPA: ABC transporter permease [Candidatus Bathyarchaeia archaeon]|nr:ABC transporter permease [Candidatus Bathyarchaeia archaeon]
MMISIRWRKVIRDLASQKSRTILVTMAIAVGVFTFGSVLATRLLLLKEMDVQYRLINAATINFSLGGFADDLVGWAGQQSGISQAQGSAAVPVKLLTGGKSYILLLQAFPDYQNITINKISPVRGVWPPDSGEILFERASLPLVREALGEEITVELASGRKEKLKFSGVTRDLQALPATIFPRLTGYVSFSTLTKLGFNNEFNRLVLRTDPNIRTLPEIETVADRLKEKLKIRGIAVTSVEVQKPDEHWGRSVTEAFVTVLSGIGTVSLVLSGFLVVNTISAVLSQQKKQIGIMKAIGANSKQIAGLYLANVTFFGLIALFVAVPIGLLLTYFNLRMVTGFLNLDVLNFYLPWQIFALEAVAALFVPVIAALIPVFSSVKLPVNEVISDYGIARRSQAGRFDQWLMLVRGLSRPVLLSLRNTFRRRGRLFLTLSTLILAGTLFVSVVNVRNSLIIELDKVLKVYNYDLFFSFAGSYDAEAVKNRAEQVSGVTATEGEIAVSAQRIKPDGSRGGTLTLFGIRPESDFLLPNLLAGRWLRSADRNVLVVGNELVRNDPGFQVGQPVVLEIGNQKYEWEVAGDMLIFGRENKVAYAPFDYLAMIRKKPRQVSSLYARTSSHESDFQSQIAGELEDRLKQGGFEITSSITTSIIRKASTGQFDFLVAFLLFMAILVAVVGGLGLAGTMSLNVLERIREIGIMRSIGASDGMIRTIILVEGVLIGFISWFLAIPLSFPISWAFGRAVGIAFMNQPLVFSYSWLGLLIWLILIVVISVLASWLPAQQAARMSVRETLAYE